MSHDRQPGEVTRLLAAARNGDADAADRLAVLIYDELRHLARRGRNARRGEADTLSTTALVHEAYLRLFDRQAAVFPDRGHFYAYAAQAMRRIVVDHARRRQTAKRGAGTHHEALDDAVVAFNVTPDQVVQLDQTLTQLHERDAQLAQLVELRVFGGLAIEELAQAMGVSTSTVKRDWRRARAMLGVSLNQGDG